MKYTPEETKDIIEMYVGSFPDQREKVIIDLAEKYDKSICSIRAKLVSEGVYIKKERVSKFTGTKPKTKFVMVDEMEREFDFQIGALAGLENAPKLVLINLYNKLIALKKLS